MPTHTLPSLPTPFIGREQELTEFANLLATPDCRLLTLTGPGGMGKTRLALEVARSQAGQYAHGVHFVALQPLASPDLIAPAIIAALGLQFFQGDPRHQLLDYLSDKTLLLVLDNVEHLLDDILLVSDILAHAPQAKILATSRERLNLREEWLYPVNGLSFPRNRQNGDLDSYDAVRLFVGSARRLRPDFSLADEAASMLELCALLDGMPLALELAASWVRALTCPEIVREIQQGLDLLETSVRNVEERHRSMRAVMEHSWRRLSNDGQAVLTKLSVFRGGFTREAAEAVAGANLHTLASLVDKSLVKQGVAGRYDLHELLRQFAEEKLLASGEAEVARDAHSAYYAAYLQQRWKPLRTDQQAKILNEIETEFENARTAWQTMVEKRKTTELSMAVYSLWLFCDLRVRYLDALALFKQAEDALRPASGDKNVDRVIGQMLTRRGWFYVSLMKLEEARALVEEGLTILQRVGNPEDVALAFYSLSCIDSFCGDSAALHYDALCQTEIAERIGDKWLLAAASFPLANAAVIAGDFEQAKKLGQRFFELSQRCGDLYLRAMCSLCVLAAVAEHEGNYADARRLGEQSLELCEAFGQKQTIAAIHNQLGWLAFCMSEYSVAQSHLGQSLSILADAGGFTHYMLDTLKNISQLWIAQGRKEDVVQILSLIVHHPETFHRLHDTAEEFLHTLQSEMPHDAFSAAQERGYTLELKGVVKKLINELSQPPQASIPITSQAATSPLTEREREILQLVADGLSNREIAERLFLAVTTVKWYVREILSKLHVNNRTQAVARARTLGMLS